LWVSSEIITKHNATVRVASRPAGAAKQSGTVFMLFFPEDGIGVPPKGPATETAQNASSEDRPREPHEVR
jgi:hypothetical protein